MEKTAAFEAGISAAMEKIAIGNTAAGMAAMGRLVARKAGMSKAVGIQSALKGL